MLNAYRELDADGLEIWFDIDAEEKARRLATEGRIIEWKPNDPFNPSEWKPYGVKHITEGTYKKVKNMCYMTALCYVSGRTYVKIKRSKDYQDYLTMGDSWDKGK